MVTHKKSFTLIEVLIFVTILSLFFVAAAAVTIVSLRNLKVQEHKILATRYAQELVEWLRGEKEENWGGELYNINNPVDSFTEKITKFRSSQAVCFNSLDWNNTSPCTYSLDSFFKRTASFTWNSNFENYIYQVNASILVEWQELGQTYQVPINSIFTIWE